MGAARFAVACLAATWLAACGLGVNGLETTGGDGGPGLDAGVDVTSGDGSHEGGTSSGAGADGASTDTGTGGDVVVTETGPVDGCVPTGPENCTNGIDDDCNGHTDCADPACMSQGYACVPALPTMGWDFEAFNATSQTGCPPTLMQKEVDVDPTSLDPAVCGCSCAPGTSPSCDMGNITASGGADKSCSTGPATFPANGGACNTQTLPVTPYVNATPPGPTGGTCNATASVTKPPTGATKGETCSGEMAFGAGCVAGDVCALVPSGYQPCLHHGGANMGCPAGYPAQNSIGTLMDTRGCGPCACGMPTATCDGTWNFYSSTACTGAVAFAAQANGACDPTGNTNAQQMFPSNMLVASPSNVGCAMPGAPPATGAVTLTGADTLCCE